MSDAAAIAVLVFVAALLQATIVAGMDIFGGTPDLLLADADRRRPAPRLGRRRGRRLRRRPAARRPDPRHARRHLAAAGRRRLLDRALRRDDGPRSPARAAPRGRGRDRPRRGGRLRPPLPDRRGGLRTAGRRSRRCCRAVGLNLLLAAPVFAALSQVPAAVRPRRAHRGGAGRWLAPSTSGARPRAVSCRPIRVSRSRTASRRSSRCGSGSSPRSRSPPSPCSSCGCGRCRCSPATATWWPRAENQVRTCAYGGAARADPRPQGPLARLERARHGRAALARRHAGGGPLPHGSAPRSDPPCAAVADHEGDRGAQGRPADADHGEDGGARRASALPEGAPVGVPRRLCRDDVPPGLRVPLARRPGARPCRRDLGGRAEGEAGRRVPGR